MKVKEFSNYRAPKRRPWIPLVVAVCLVVLVVLLVRRGCNRKPSVSHDLDVVATNVVSAPDQKNIASGDTDKSQEEVVVSLPGDVSALMERAAQYYRSDQLQSARALYQRALLMTSDDVVRTQIEKPLGDIHIELLFSQRPMPEKVEYTIKRGDQLRMIARKHATTVELIQAGNNITNPNRIRIGDQLRIFTGDFEIVASKSRRDMVVYLNGTFFKRYRIGTGVFGKTPEGTFRIDDKIVEPSWWPPDGREVPFGDEENILGTRWMSIEATGETPRVRGYGIHGTWDPESIGKEESAGCIRMHNDDVEELYVYIPYGTPVRIVE